MVLTGVAADWEYAYRYHADGSPQVTQLYIYRYIRFSTTHQAMPPLLLKAAGPQKDCRYFFVRSPGLSIQNDKTSHATMKSDRIATIERGAVRKASDATDLRTQPTGQGHS